MFLKKEGFTNNITKWFSIGIVICGILIGVGKILMNLQVNDKRIAKIEEIRADVRIALIEKDINYIKDNSEKQSRMLERIERKLDR